MRIVRIAEMLGRDLGRRRVTLLLIAALPLVFYFVQNGGSRSEQLTSGGVGASWGVAGAALFSTLGARTVDQRLVLDGMRPIEILVGRVILLLAVGLALVAGLGALMWAFTGPPSPLDMAIALVLMVVVAVPLGLTVGAVVPHELEGTLLIIAVVGIQISLGAHSAFVGALPLGGAQRLLSRAGGGVFSRGEAVTRSLGWALMLGAAAGGLFVWRVAHRVMVRGFVVFAVGLGVVFIPWSAPRGSCLSSGPITPRVVDEGLDPYFGFATTTAAELRGSDGAWYQVFGGQLIGVTRVTCGRFVEHVYRVPAPVRLVAVSGDVVSFTAASGPGRFDVVRGVFVR